MARHLALGPVFGALALALLALSPSARADAALVQVAIDTDVAGNSDNALGPTESCNTTTLQVGETIDVDVVVRGVPEYDPSAPGSETEPSGGIAGFEFNFRFDPAVVEVQSVLAYNGPTILKAEGSYLQSAFLDYAPGNDNWEPPPGTQGDVLVIILDASTAYENGDGVLTRVRLRAVGNGVSRLELQYSLAHLRDPQLYSANTIAYPVNSIPGAIAVGVDPCPASTPDAFPTATPNRPRSTRPAPTPVAGAHVWIEPAVVPVGEPTEIFVKATVKDADVGYYNFALKISNATFFSCANAPSCAISGDVVDFSKFTPDQLVGELTLGSATIRADGSGTIAELEGLALQTSTQVPIAVSEGNTIVTASTDPSLIVPKMTEPPRPTRPQERTTTASPGVLAETVVPEDGGSSLHITTIAASVAALGATGALTAGGYVLLQRRRKDDA